MPRNGSGTYALPAGNPVVTGTTISSTVQNATMSDVAAALTASIAADGQTPATANLPMGGFRHINTGAALTLGQYVRADQVQNSTLQVLGSVSGTDTITASNGVAPTAYAAGQTFRFAAAGTNTGPVTLNVNSLGAKDITKFGATPLIASDIINGQTVEVYYDGTQFQLSNANRAVSYSMATARMLGRSSGGTGAVEEISVGAALSLSSGVLNLPTASLTDVTGSRSAGVNYANSSGRPMFVAVRASVTANPAQLEMIVNTQTVQTEYVNSASATSYILSACAVVPIGGTYQFNFPLGNATLDSLWELA
jgi:hypothetical protein